MIAAVVPARRKHMDWNRVRTIARTDLKQLAQARDFWLPLMIVALLSAVNNITIDAIATHMPMR